MLPLLLGATACSCRMPVENTNGGYKRHRKWIRPLPELKDILAPISGLCSAASRSARRRGSPSPTGRYVTRLLRCSAVDIPRGYEGAWQQSGVFCFPVVQEKLEHMGTDTTNSEGLFATWCGHTEAANSQSTSPIPGAFEEEKSMSRS